MNIGNDLLYLLAHVGLAVVLLLLELLHPLEHFLHGVRHIQLLLCELPLQSAKSVCKVFYIRPRPVSLRLLDLRYDILVV